MSQHTFGALAVGLVAVVLGIIWLAGALSRLRRRSDMTTNMGSSASGIYTYTLSQVGCGAVLVIAGVVVTVLALVR